ncbi:MAG TPA: S53 family peptidase [Micromonosporaceae bacterium]|nr:S53 family peptidase [Micromonosporaceae bacterium]
MRSDLARRFTTRRVLVLVGAAVLTVPFATSSAFAATSGRATLGGSSPSWATSNRVVGSPSASTKITFNVVLPLRNAAAADKLALAVSNPNSSSYGRYLTASQFNARFAPTNAQVKAVSSFLRGAGLKVTGTAQGNRWVSASGTVSQINSAFATTLRNYSYKGKLIHAPSKALSVPRSVSSLIAGVVGVTNDGALLTPSHVVVSGGSTADSSTGPSDALPPPSQCSVFWDQHEQTGPPAFGRTSFPTPNCGYTAAQLRGAYNVQSAVSHGNNGHGQTVAIIDAYDNGTALADANALSDRSGEPEFAPGQFTVTDFTPFNLQDECAPASWAVEQSLDIEAIHGMAPGANINYIGAQNCDTGIDDAVNFVIQNHVADIVSNSYGFIGEDGLGDEVATEHSLFTQAAIQGIGFYFSSGDFGDNVFTFGLPHPEPDFPASDPLVTAVGGTSLALKPSNSILFESQWGNFIDATNTATSPSSYTEPLPGHFNSGAGGGVSALFTEPIYQKGTVPNSLAKLNGKTAMRVTPDVGAVADPETGFGIISGGASLTIGGTSLACPVFAGVQALASQGRLFPIGFANPLLYTIGHIPSTFNDVKSPTSTLAMMTTSGRTLITMAMDTSLTATKGYDDTTGIGTPNGPGLLLFEHIIP